MFFSILWFASYNNSIPLAAQPNLPIYRECNSICHARTRWKATDSQNTRHSYLLYFSTPHWVSDPMYCCTLILITYFDIIMCMDDVLMSMLFIWFLIDSSPVMMITATPYLCSLYYFQWLYLLYIGIALRGRFTRLLCKKHICHLVSVIRFDDSAST